jgi:hypothetical protein
MDRRRVLIGMSALAAAGGVARAEGAPQGAKNVDAGDAAARQLLALMDTDKNGKVSRAEFMAFMAAEFDRLDANHDGELDVKELTQIQIRHQGGHTR